jgi:hypothetical protein
MSSLGATDGIREVLGNACYFTLKRLEDFVALRYPQNKSRVLDDMLWDLQYMWWDQLELCVCVKNPKFYIAPALLDLDQQAQIQVCLGHMVHMKLITRESVKKLDVVAVDKIPQLVSEMIRILTDFANTGTKRFPDNQKKQRVFKCTVLLLIDVWRLRIWEMHAKEAMAKRR